VRFNIGLCVWSNIELELRSILGWNRETKETEAKMIEAQKKVVDYVKAKYFSQLKSSFGGMRRK
jgi:hypothetical protein